VGRYGPRNDKHCGPLSLSTRLKSCLFNGQRDAHVLFSVPKHYPRITLPQSPPLTQTQLKLPFLNVITGHQAAVGVRRRRRSEGGPKEVIPCAGPVAARNARKLTMMCELTRFDWLSNEPSFRFSSKAYRINK
jgi:hypothetical protein